MSHRRTVQKLLKEMSKRSARAREAAEAKLLRLGPAGVEPLLAALGAGPPSVSASAARVLLQLCATASVADTAAEHGHPYRLSPPELEGDGLGDQRGMVYSAVKEALFQIEAVDLGGIDLSGVDQCGVNLQMASLRGATLRGANLQDACLSGADLREADLEGARYDGATIWPRGFGPHTRGAVKEEGSNDEEAGVPDDSGDKGANG